MSTSRIFLKPKVRDTAEKVSSSVCSGGDNDDFDIDFKELDNNNQSGNPKITIKPKRHNSQFNFDDTTSELGGNTTDYSNTSKTLKGRKLSGNNSDDSSLFFSGIEDFYEKQDKLKSTYNPNPNLMLKLNLKDPNLYNDENDNEKDDFNYNDVHDMEKYPNYYNNSNMRNSNQNKPLITYDENFTFDDIHEMEKYQNFLNNSNTKNLNQNKILSSHDENFTFDDIHEMEKYQKYLNNSNIKNLDENNKQLSNVDENFRISDIYEMEKYQKYFNQKYRDCVNFDNDEVSEMGLDTERDDIRCLTRKPVTIYIDEALLNEYEGDIESESHQIPSIRKIKSKSLRINNNNYNNSIKKHNKSSFTDYLNYFGSIDDIEELEKMKEREKIKNKEHNSLSKSKQEQQQFDEEFSKHFTDDDSSVFIGDIDDIDGTENENECDTSGKSIHENEKNMRELTINLTDKLDFLINKKRQSLIPKNKDKNNDNLLSDESYNLYEGDIESISGGDILNNDNNNNNNDNKLNTLNSSQYIENPNDLSSFFEREMFNLPIENTKKKKIKSSLGEIQEFENVDDQEILDFHALKVQKLFILFHSDFSFIHNFFMLFFLNLIFF